MLASGYRLTVVVPIVVDQSPGRARDLCWLETNGYSAGDSSFCSGSVSRQRQGTKLDSGWSGYRY